MLKEGIKGTQEVVVSEEIQLRQWEAVHWMCLRHLP